MAIASVVHPARERALVGIVAVLLALAATIGDPLQGQETASAQAATGRPRAVIVVGPAEGRTSEYVREARQIAAQLRLYGAGVREIYSPNATWSRVSEASRGATLLVYLGRGKGHPGPDGTFDPRTMNGLGLNRTPASGHANLRYYGEYYIRRSLRLAPGAVVILGRVPYAAGSSEPGYAHPARTTATKRADNYAAGFLGAGARIVFANDRSVARIVRDLFGANLPMRSVFWRSPSASTQHASTFTSRRTPGSSGVLALDSAGQYYESVVGHLHWATADWRQTPSTPTVRVTSIPALLTALANNNVDEIVVANGTYRVSGASNRQADSLWIGDRFAARTRPVLVRAETTGGVIFDGGGSTYWIGLAFEDGAHHQTWQGFTFANGKPTSTGAIVFGGWAGKAAPHHITLRDITVTRTVTTDNGLGVTRDHGIYVSQALGGVHDILVDGYTVDGAGGLDSAVNFGHETLPDSPNAWNVTVRNMRVTGTETTIIFWESSVKNVLIEDATITGATRFAARYEIAGNNIVLRRVVSTGSGVRGLYTPLGANPPGLTLENCDLR